MRLLLLNLLINRVHFDVALNLGHRDAFAVSARDYIIKAQDEVERFVVDCLLVDALRLALGHDNLLHLTDDLDVFNDVGLLGRDEHKEQFFHGLVHVANSICLDECALLA